MVVRGGSTDAIVLVVVLVLLDWSWGVAVVLVMKMMYLPICLPSKTQLIQSGKGFFLT